MQIKSYSWCVQKWVANMQCAKMQHSMRHISVSIENGMQSKGIVVPGQLSARLSDMKPLSLLIKFHLTIFVNEEASPFCYPLHIIGANFSPLSTHIGEQFESTQTRSNAFIIFHRQQWRDSPNTSTIQTMHPSNGIEHLSMLCLMCIACICIVARCVVKHTIYTHTVKLLRIGPANEQSQVEKVTTNNILVLSHSNQPTIQPTVHPFINYVHGSTPSNHTLLHFKHVYKWPDSKISMAHWQILLTFKFYRCNTFKTHTKRIKFYYSNKVDEENLWTKRKWNGKNPEYPIAKKMRESSNKRKEEKMKKKLPSKWTFWIKSNSRTKLKQQRESNNNENNERRNVKKLGKIRANV